MPDVPNALCYPACHACGVAGICERQAEAIANVKKAARKPRQWAPNQLRQEALSCGCTQIPWPMTKVFGRNITTVECSMHGEVEYKPAKPKANPRLPEVHYDQDEIPF